MEASLSDVGTEVDTEVDNFAPVTREIEADNLAVRGTLPEGLRGTLYRIGPNPRFPQPEAHWFGGDGMVHAFQIDGGRVSYRNRWVRTPKWRDEDRAGRALFRAFAGKLPDAPDWSGSDSGVANTNIIWHAGALLALEEAHMPTAVTPRTVETLGYMEYGPLKGPFTAHPKTDPQTGELLFFGYNADGKLTPGVQIGAIDAHGRLTHYARFQAPYPSMIHDFMATPRHLLIPVLPLTGSLARVEQGRPGYAWEPDKPAMIGVLPRRGSAEDVRWFEGPACYMFHVMNAWEDGNRILADVMVYDEPPLFPHADGSPGNPERQQAYLTRWTFDLSAGTRRFAAERLDDTAGEFPRIDDRLSGVRHRHGWFAASHREYGDGELNGIMHLDMSTGARDAYWLPAGDITSEPVFAPRGSEEGDGWILAVVWRAAAQCSELLVFDARHVAAGPVATVELPQRVPFGFHGNWVAG
jgi:carotenoid cleavage dioxygenase